MPGICLDAFQIFDATAREHGLEQYADPLLRDRFAELIQHFNQNAPVPEWAFPGAVSQLSALVHTRLQLERDWSRHPAIENERIDRPIFVVGSGRTGSTMMQTLLALGDGCRAPKFWECWRPSPPPGLDPPSEPARIAAENEHFIRDFINVAPGMLLAHPYFDQGGLADLEDEEIFTIDFRTASPMHLCRVPSLPIVHHKGLAGLRESLRFHKRMLQHLQWKRPTRHWVLKTTQHFFQLPLTWEVYPDAVCVWTHRDPVNFVGSVLALMHHLYTPATGKIIRGEFAHELAEGLAVAYAAILDSDWIDDDRIAHVRFEDFVRDPIDTVRRSHALLGRDFTPSHAARIGAWLQDPANRSDRHGRFIYSVEEFGLDAAEIRRKFSGYYRRFLR